MTNLTPTVDLRQLTVFHGDLNPQQAHIYVRLAGFQDQGGWQLRGNIRGPTNHLTRTLPATVTLRDLGPGSHLLARAILPDPCFWAPGQPYLYDVHVEFVVDDKVIATEARAFGMRMLGVHGNRIYKESRPWQLVGANDTFVEPTDGTAWRKTMMVRRLKAPSDQQCDQASGEGVMLLVDLDYPLSADAMGLEREMLRLGRHAAVAIVAVPEGAVMTQQTRACVPNLLVAQRCSALQAVVPCDWADLVIYEVDDLQTLETQLRECRLPVLVQHVGGGVVTLDRAAHQCQQLVATLEPIQCVAGCLV